MPSNHLILSSPSPSVLNLSQHQGLFQWVSSSPTSGGQSIGVSASTSVLPMNTQDSSPLGWAGWISLQSKGLSRVFSQTTVEKHQFFSHSRPENQLSLPEGAGQLSKSKKEIFAFYLSHFITQCLRCSWPRERGRRRSVQIPNPDLGPLLPPT